MFEKILIADRGEIALRVIRACQEMGIATVAVHSQADTHSLHVSFADEDVCIGPAAGKDSYRNIVNIISAAELTNADAIHPGYGPLAENADFSEICADCGIQFIGPTTTAIRKMGGQGRRPPHCAGGRRARSAGQRGRTPIAGRYSPMGGKDRLPAASQGRCWWWRARYEGRP